MNAASDSERVSRAEDQSAVYAEKAAAETDYLRGQAERERANLRANMLSEAIRAEGQHATPEEILATAAKFASFVDGAPKPKPPPPAIPIAKLKEALVYLYAHRQVMDVAIKIELEPDGFRLVGTSLRPMGFGCSHRVGFEALEVTFGNPLMQAMATIYKQLS